MVTPMLGEVVCVYVCVCIRSRESDGHSCAR